MHTRDDEILEARQDAWMLFARCHRDLPPPRVLHPRGKRDMAISRGVELSANQSRIARVWLARLLSLPSRRRFHAFAAMSGCQSERIFCAQQINIPPTFPQVLRSYAKAAIRTQPYDLLRWTGAYFRALANGERPPVKVSALSATSASRDLPSSP